MGKNANLSSHGEGALEDSLVLSDLLRPLWDGRKIILAVVSITLVLGMAGSTLLTKYKSEGFFQFGGAIPLPDPVLVKNKDKAPGSGITLADYKRYSASFSASGRFEDYVREKQLTGIDGVDGLRNSFAAPGGVSKLLEPMYPFTKLDAKELMDQPKDSSNNVIGLKINYDGKTPKIAQNIVDLLGHYAMDTIVYSIYLDNLRYKHDEIVSKLTELDNKIIDLEQKLVEYQRKGTTLKQIVGRYPAAVNEAGRQVVSITDDNARFLSPMTHLMSTEVEALEANEAILKAKRRQKQLRLQLEYFDEAGKLINSTKLGEKVLRALDPIKERLFKNKDLQDELVKEVYNEISIENANATTLYLEKSRFIAGPTLPTHRSSSLLLALIASLFAGLILAVAIVLGREWGRTNWPKAAL